MEMKNPKDWKRRSPYLMQHCNLRVVLVALMLCLSVVATAGTLRLNPGDDPSNAIVFDGSVNATVVTSSAGVDIIIPGVIFSLSCEGTPSETCVLDVSGSGAPLAASTPPSETQAPDATENPDSDPSDGDKCEGATGFGLNYDCGEQTASADADADADADAGGAWDDDTSGSGDSSGKPSAWSSTETTTDVPDYESKPFPASDRIYDLSGPDLGSAGSNATGNTFLVKLPLESVTVLPFTMSSEKVSGGLGFFQPSSSPLGASLHFWLSRQQDGDAVSGCIHVGNYDGKLGLSTDGSAECDLSPGTKYFLNLAACISATGDYACRDGAETALREGNVLLSASY